MFGAIIGAIAGAAYNGVSTYMNNNKLAGAYKDYASALENAAKKYSGKSAERAMQNAGEQVANNYGVRDWSSASSQGIDPYHMNLQNRTSEGFNTGAGIASELNNAKYNKEMAEQQSKLKQAGVDFNVANQTQQTAMNTAGGLVDLGKQLSSGKSNNNGQNIK